MKKIIFIFVISSFFVLNSCDNFSQTNKMNGKEFISKYKANEDIIIDVRTNSEFSEGHLNDAKNIDVNDDNFEKNISSLDKKKTYYLYCRSGNRSSKALKIMQKLGFTKVFNLGAYQDLVNEGVK